MEAYVNKDVAKAFLVQKIISLQGVKATELASDKETVLALANFDVPGLLVELVHERKITEIEYALPEMKWRLKSFYLPANTELTVKGAGIQMELK